MKEGPPERIVSLVPSLTEALFALELGDRVVGVTDWCVHPAEAVAELPKVGGTKDPDVEAIAKLAPDLVIANREENTQRSVRHLEERGLHVWVTYPLTVRDGVELLDAIADLGATDAARTRVVAPSRAALEAAEGELPREPTRVFCPIWRDPWMAVGSDTYADDLLRVCGGANVFADREGRYPKVGLDEIASAAPHVIVLPDEPYAFGAADVQDLSRLDVPAARTGRIHPIDGTLVSWYGPRIESAIRTLRPLLAHPPD